MVRAAILDKGDIIISDIPEPEPMEGQALVRTLACGICGSDLHRIATSRQGNQPCVVLGHEFCAEILDYGPQTQRKLPVGSPVVSFPYIIGKKGPEIIGFTPNFPGGFSERMVLGVDDLIEVPNGLPSTLAAVTEPLAVGEHVAAIGQVEAGDIALVVGCGPVGLAVIVALRRRGCDTIIATDFSRERRELAEQLGAGTTFDPSQESPYDAWDRWGVDGTAASAMLAYAFRRARRRVIIFECVGAPGVIASIIEGAPLGATIVVAGACMGEDKFIPVRALTKELELRFASAYSHEEFAGTLMRIADGTIDAAAMITREVNLDHIADAISALSSPTDAKVMIRHDGG